MYVTIFVYDLYPKTIFFYIFEEAEIDAVLFAIHAKFKFNNFQIFLFLVQCPEQESLNILINI